MKNLTKTLLALAILAPLGAYAQNNTEGYLVDSSGTPVKSGTGLCWHTGSYEANKTNHPECDVQKPKEVIVDRIQKPQTPEVVVVEPQVNLPAALEPVSTTVLFAFDSAVITKEQSQKLDAVISRDGKAFDRLTINIVGYTDPIGTEKYNIKLSKARAWAVLNYLKSHGVNVGNIDVSGKGEHDLVVECKAHDIACNQPNRRAVITIKE